MKNKPCPECHYEVPYLIKVRVSSGAYHFRCEECDNRIRKNTTASLVEIDVTRFRPKFMRI